MVNTIRNSRFRDKNEDQGTPPVNVYLFIPYFDGDIGARPLPANVLSYLCPNILVNGASYNGKPLQKGQTVGLSVKICNLGTKVARNVITRIYWANPTVGFLRSQIAKNILAQVQTPVLPTGGSIITTEETPWTIQDYIPEHVCLVAEVTNSQDLAPNSIDVSIDHHFAQQNLNVIKVTPGQKLLFPIQIAQLVNDRQFKIHTRPVTGMQLELLAREIEARPAQISVSNIQLHSYGNVRLTGRQRLSEMGRAELKTCELEFAIPENVHSGEFVAIEVIMTDDKDLDRAIGGLVVVALVD